MVPKAETERVVEVMVGSRRRKDESMGSIMAVGVLAGPLMLRPNYNYII